MNKWNALKTKELRRDKKELRNFKGTEISKKEILKKAF